MLYIVSFNHNHIIISHFQHAPFNQHIVLFFLIGNLPFQFRILIQARVWVSDPLSRFQGSGEQEDLAALWVSEGDKA